MEEQKAWWQSSGIWGGVGAAAAGVAGLFGYTITEVDQAQIVNSVQQAIGLVTSIGALVGGVVAVVGRVRASKTIGAQTSQS